MLALAYQTRAAIRHLLDSAAIRSFRDVTKVRTNVESIVPVETRELELSALAHLPNIIEDHRPVRRLLFLSRVDRIVRHRDVDRNQSRLICEAVVADSINA